MQLSSQLTISVVIPIYNRGEKIAATLDSVFAQTLAPLEIILVDDGSTDGTADWIEAHYAGRIRLIRQANGGVARARNRGLEASNGEWIAFLDHDDEWAPEKLDKQLALAQINPETGVVYCAWSCLDANGKVTENGTERLRAGAVTWPQGQVFSALLRHDFIISMSVPLIKTNLLRKIGGFDPQTVPADDWDVWLRLARHCEFAFVPEVLVFYRFHDAQQSADQLQILKGKQRVFAKHRKYLFSHPKALWFYASAAYFFKTTDPFYHQAREALAQFDWKATRRVIFRALRRYPLLWLTPQWLYLFKRLVRRDGRPF